MRDEERRANVQNFQTKEQLLIKHTPGPWRICGNDRGGCKCGNVWSKKHDFVVARAISKLSYGQLDEGCSEETAVANARLIAAAPDLLAALEKIVEIEREERDCFAANAEMANVAIEAIALVK